MSDHALLSPSGAHKWLNCPASARLEETLPESTSEYAEEGRLAHAIAELKLRKHFIEPMGMRAFNSRLKKLQENPLYKDEMLHHTDAYLEYICGITHGFATVPYVAAEKQLDLSGYAPESFGTSDCIIIHSDIMYVIDFKYGKGVPVSAENNPQMMLYALGAYTAYSFLYPIARVKLAIVQPRIGEPSEWELSLQELVEWGEAIKPVAQKAFLGVGECNPGEWCSKGFCRARSQCRARAEANLALGEFQQMKPPLISDEEVGSILKQAQNLAKWVKDLQAYALGELLQGKDIPGWKAVNGRGERQFVNLDEAF